MSLGRRHAGFKTSATHRRHVSGRFVNRHVNRFVTKRDDRVLDTAFWTRDRLQDESPVERAPTPSIRASRHGVSNVSNDSYDRGHARIADSVRENDFCFFFFLFDLGRNNRMAFRSYIAVYDSD